MAVTYDLGVCAIARDMIFGWVMYTEHGWLPFADVVYALADQPHVTNRIELALNNPVVPDEARDAWRSVDIVF